MTEEELRDKDLELRQRQLEFERVKVFVEFAKFGFAGTLTAALVGAALIAALATLDAFTEFHISDSALVGLGFIVLVGTATFGYLSLWEAPRIAAKLKDRFELTMSAGEKKG